MGLAKSSPKACTGGPGWAGVKTTGAAAGAPGGGGTAQAQQRQGGGVGLFGGEAVDEGAEEGVEVEGHGCI